MIADRIAKVALFCLIAALIGGLFGCEQVFNIFIDGDMSAPSPDPVVVVKEREIVNVGLVLPLTGSAAGPYGLSMERGYLLARDDINSLIYSGARINFITIDDMSTAEGQVNAFILGIGKYCVFSWYKSGIIWKGGFCGFKLTFM